MCIKTQSFGKGWNEPMNVILKQSENRVGLYLDDTHNTVFEGESIEDVLEWVNKNLLNAKIHVVK